MFASRISTPVLGDPSAEDIFESALSTIFTDVTQNSHGAPGASVTYHSPRFGPVSLRIPTHPDVEDGRKLFAHYLWNAGVIAADAIEVASREQEGYDAAEAVRPSDDDASRERIVDWDKRYWNVRGKRVLEIGAATALPSVISALSGCCAVTITDHPSSPALTMGAIQQNIRQNVLNRNEKTEKNDELSKPSEPTPEDRIQVLGYAWGTETMYMTESYGKPVSPQPRPGTFARIVIADCLWMPSQHVNIVKTILRYLIVQEDDTDQGTSIPPHDEVTTPQQPCALVVAGFHTGRGTVRNFFGVATGEWDEQAIEEAEQKGKGEEGEAEDPELAAVSGRLKVLEIFEIDVDGNKRLWQQRREGETKDQAKRWCVCAVLGRR